MDGVDGVVGSGHPLDYGIYYYDQYYSNIIIIIIICIGVWRGVHCSERGRCKRRMVRVSSGVLNGENGKCEPFSRFKHRFGDMRDRSRLLNRPEVNFSSSFVTLCNLCRAYVLSCNMKMCYMTLDGV